jgi:hypothetical protein
VHHELRPPPRPAMTFGIDPCLPLQGRGVFSARRGVVPECPTSSHEELTGGVRTSQGNKSREIFFREAPFFLRKDLRGAVTYDK